MTASVDEVEVAEALRSYLPLGVELTVRLRRNRRTLLGLRGTPRSWHLTVHPAVLSNNAWSVCIGEWLTRRGRGGAGADLHDLLASVRAAANQADPQALLRIAQLPTIGGGFDLDAAMARMHRDWFGDLPCPTVAWARRPPARRLSHLRFGCYRRRGGGSVELNPRLARPWVARCFVDHVIHHELCHHRQALHPLSRRERPHSPRFKRWEAEFPGLDDAIAWERQALTWLLEDRNPPWYQANQEST
jgi:predicted SprT family Zn-dependent metalloprotease